MDFSESFTHLNHEMGEKLQHEFFELVDTLISASRSVPNADESDNDDVVHVMSFHKVYQQKYIVSCINTRLTVTGISFGRGIKPAEATGRSVEVGRTEAHGKSFL